MVAGVTKRDMIAAAAGAVVARYPWMTVNAAQSVATKAWKVGGWQAVAGLYALQTNPQRPIDIPGPINVGWTPREQQVIDFAVDQASRAGQFLREEVFIPETIAVARERGKISVPTAARKKTKFNRAVSAGMKAAKASKYYGKKGTLSSPKKAFSAVTKIASKLSRGKAVRRTGSSGVIARAMPKWGKGPRSGR